MIYNVIIKGFSVGITRDYKEAQSWLADSVPDRSNRIARPDQIPNHRNYKC